MKLKKCIVLLPTSYDDGTRVPARVLSDILRSIDTAFDGHTVDGLVHGSYKMDDGTMVTDESLKVWVALAPDQVDKAREMAKQFAAVLKQESLYFEVTDAEVEFVRPDPEPEGGQ